MELEALIDAEQLGRWLSEQRWFASKTREPAGFRMLEVAPLDEDPEPVVVLALVEVAFGAGTHELYQLPLGLRHKDEGWTESVILEAGDRTVYDAMVDPACALRLLGAMRRGHTTEHGDAQWTFAGVGELPDPAQVGETRPIGVEQSNSSTVFGDELILKVYRRIEPGPNPELELLRFLTDHDFQHIAQLRGFYEHNGRLVDATLGLLQEFLPSAGDGWDLVLDALEQGRAEEILDDIADLGRVTAELHTVLGSDANDPTFTPEEPSAESLSLLLATVDEDIEDIFRDLPEGHGGVDEIRHRGQEVRDQLRGLAHAGGGGRNIRTHGDFHLGQCLLTDRRGWVVLDFEGEPARSLPERRQKRSPLRDVAGMLRSFAYAGVAAELQRGAQAPEGWEDRARGAFLDAYLERVDTRLLPHGQSNTERMLQIFELEKAVYELRYEMNNRPDWVRIPVAGIARLLEAEIE
jgi:trehalose synthase-fused probable maltokinase